MNSSDKIEHRSQERWLRCVPNKSRGLPQLLSPRESRTALLGLSGQGLFRNLLVKHWEPTQHSSVCPAVPPPDEGNAPGPQGGGTRGDQPGNVSQLQTAGRAGIRAHGRPAASSLLSSLKAAQLREGV